MSARRAAPLEERRSSFVALPIPSLSSFRSHLPFLVRIGKKEAVREKGEESARVGSAEEEEGGRSREEWKSS